MTLLILGSVLFILSHLIAVFGSRQNRSHRRTSRLYGACHNSFDNQLDHGRYGISADKLSAALVAAPRILSIGQLSHAHRRHIAGRGQCARQYRALHQASDADRHCALGISSPTGQWRFVINHHIHHLWRLCDLPTLNPATQTI